MSVTTSEAFDLRMTYLALDGEGGVVKLPAGPEFWETIDRNPAARGTLMTAGAVDAAWTHWEMHPKGEEIVMLLSGDIDFIFETPDGEQAHRTGPGEVIVVPRGTWHRATVRKPGRMLFLTFGEGTRHKPLNPSS
jgi:quercetin dioxygenase-like cupin family protein